MNLVCRANTARDLFLYSPWAKNGFYTFKWLKKFFVCETWKLYEVQTSSSINTILLGHSHAPLFIIYSRQKFWTEAPCGTVIPYTAVGWTTNQWLRYTLCPMNYCSKKKNSHTKIFFVKRENCMKFKLQVSSYSTQLLGEPQISNSVIPYASMNHCSILLFLFSLPVHTIYVRTRRKRGELGLCVSAFKAQ